MSGFVNYVDGAEYRHVCINCFEVFDERQSKRKEHCSRYCAKQYEMKIYGLTGDDDATEEEGQEAG